MSYTGWALLAMVGYGFTAMFLKLSMRSIPPEAALVISNAILVTTGLVWAMVRGVSFVTTFTFGLPTLYLATAGVTLSISIMCYYIALSRGPTSVVLPIFALNLTIAAALGILVLDEPAKASHILGILMAIGAILLLTR